MQNSCLKTSAWWSQSSHFVENGYPSLRFSNMVKVNIHEHWTRVTRFNPLWVSAYTYRSLTYTCLGLTYTYRDLTYSYRGLTYTYRGLAYTYRDSLYRDSTVMYFCGAFWWVRSQNVCAIKTVMFFFSFLLSGKKANTNKGRKNLFTSRSLVPAYFKGPFSYSCFIFSSTLWL